MCALYVFDNRGEYGTTQRLSTSITPFFMCTVDEFPPSSVDRLLYRGYPSSHVIVLAVNARGYFIEHFPSTMHGEFGFSVSHGPCIMFLIITACKSLSTSACGISAHITPSISSEVILL
ncbi:hypothetical protein AVEN_145967-1 [Araneus ventricosus]|uniref:Uncharacterized protein n=1 Tax=Araneus ventricosus TaxID=182803 RepID=A0A4Y2IV77_ARAVE|nr:hypothetical protein AVEN_145967-1 [Araneus ventricosus]